MKPRKIQNHPELFRSQLSEIINLNHALVRLSQRINWQRLEERIDTIYSEASGQPPLPTRLMVALHYLKYTFNESDESVVLRWVEKSYCQMWCMEIMQSPVDESPFLSLH